MDNRPLAVGDVCVIVFSETRPDVVGAQVTLMERFVGDAITLLGTRFFDGWIISGVTPLFGTTRTAANTAQLRRLPPPADADSTDTPNAVTQWGKCAWRPSKERV